MRIRLLFTFLAYSTISYGIDYNILDFGAVNSQTVLSTTPIQEAIDLAGKSTNGRVIIPKGNFLTGSLQLHSNVELHLEKGACLYGSVNVEDYYALSKTTATYNWKSLLIAINCTNISITGHGTIDGQGTALAMNIDDQFYNGSLDSNLYNLKDRRPRAHVRPQLIQFVNCSNITIESVKIKNAASWVQVYDLCSNVIIKDISVESVAYWNNDGIDVIDCNNVIISNCKINSSDDGICLKSYKRSIIPQPKCDSIQIFNCIVRSSASAVKLGTSSYGGFTNISIRNITVYDTYRSAIAIESWEGGVINNIQIENIVANNTGNALFIKLNKRPIYANRPNGSITNVFVKNIKCTVPFIQPDIKYNLRGPALPFFHNVFPISITGLPGNKVSNIVIENIQVKYPGKGTSNYANAPLSRLNEIPEKVEDYPEFSMFGELPAWGLYARHVDGLSLTNSTFRIKNDDYRPAIVLDDVREITKLKVKIKGDKKDSTIFRSPESK